MKCIYCGSGMEYSDKFGNDSFVCVNCNARLEITQHEESSLRDIIDYGRGVKPIPEGCDINGIQTFFIRGNK